MNHRHAPRILVSLVFALAGGCDEEASGPSPTDRIDLEAAGVASIDATADGYGLFDGKGNDVGRVDVDTSADGSEGSLRVALRDHVVEVEWADDMVTATCDEQAPASQATDVDEAGGLDACGDALWVGEQIAKTSEISGPWPESEAPQSEFRSTCLTSSTWTFGSCFACYSAARSALGGQVIGWNHVGGSCSSGSVYTTCSHTFCSPGGGGILPELPTGS